MSCDRQDLSRTGQQWSSLQLVDEGMRCEDSHLMPLVHQEGNCISLAGDAAGIATEFGSGQQQIYAVQLRLVEEPSSNLSQLYM